MQVDFYCLDLFHFVVVVVVVVDIWFGTSPDIRKTLLKIFRVRYEYMISVLCYFLCILIDWYAIKSWIEWKVEIEIIFFFVCVYTKFICSQFLWFTFLCNMCVIGKLESWEKMFFSWFIFHDQKRTSHFIRCT